MNWTSKEWTEWQAENARLFKEGWSFDFINKSDGSIERWAEKDGVKINRTPLDTRPTLGSFPVIIYNGGKKPLNLEIYNGKVWISWKKIPLINEPLHNDMSLQLRKPISHSVVLTTWKQVRYS